MGRAAVPLAQRIIRRTSTSGECLLWRGCVTKDGYGLVREGSAGSKLLYVHRWSYETHLGTIPPGHDVHHTCGHRRCWNPEHLTAVPAKVNRGRISPMLARYVQSLDKSLLAIRKCHDNYEEEREIRDG